MDGAQIIKNAVDPYWFFANEISKDTCQKIIDLGKKKWKKATVQTNFNSENQYDEKQRITDIAWCNERWVYDLVWHYLEVANQNSNWNFQIDSCESMQIARYKKMVILYFIKTVTDLQDLTIITNLHMAKLENYQCQ